MDLGWLQLSGYVTWSSSQGHERDQRNELCQMNGEGQRRQGRKDAGRGKRELSFLSTRPPGRVISLVSWVFCGKQGRD